MANLKRRLESLFAIDSYETSEPNAPIDTINIKNKKTKKIKQLIKDDPIYEVIDPSLDDKKSICIDFDGVIHEYNSWNNGQLNPKAVEGAKEAIDHLKDKYKIIIFTTRACKKYNINPTSKYLVEKIKIWLKDHDIYYDDITSDKIGAIAYIDDKAIRFENNWNDILTMIDNSLMEG